MALPGRFVMTPNSFWPFFFFSAESIRSMRLWAARRRAALDCSSGLLGRAGLPDGVRWTVEVVAGLLASFRVG